jgi:hypothetical protein
MSTHALKAGDRVRVKESDHMHGYQAGDKGTVFQGPMYSADGSRCYHVAMDKDSLTQTTPIFTEDEIEPDV